MQMLRQAGAVRAPLWPIALSRMLIGVLWLFSLRWKLPPDFAPADRQRPAGLAATGGPAPHL